MAYYLGSRASTAEAVTAAGRAEWGDGYPQHNGVLTAAFSIGHAVDKHKRDGVQIRLRHPVFKRIGQGDFGGAYDMMRQAVQRDASLFSPASSRFLLQTPPPVFE